MYRVDIYLLYLGLYVQGGYIYLLYLGLYVQGGYTSPISLTSVNKHNVDLDLVSYKIKCISVEIIPLENSMKIKIN